MPSGVSKLRIVEVQEGGSGSNNWQILYMTDSTTQVKMGTVSGGGIDFTDQYARDWAAGGQLAIINTVQTGQPQPFEFDLELPVEVRASALNYFNVIRGRKNIRVRHFSGEPTVPTNFQRIDMYSNCLNTALPGATTGDMVNDMENIGDPLRMSIGQRAGAWVPIMPVQHQRLTTSLTQAVNAVISVGYPRTAGDVSGENTNNDGLQEWIAVTAKDGSNLPHLLWTQNKGATWTDVTLTGMTNMDATGVTKAGQYIVVSGSGVGGGLVYAKWDDVKAGTATWTRSTNISAGTVVNAVAAPSWGTTVYACGAAGAIYKSTDAGVTFSSAGTAVTANALNEIAVADETLIWFGGASGTLVKMYNGVMSVVTVTGISTNAINALAVPPGVNRGTELFVGAANGNIYVTTNSMATTPTFATRSFDQSGTGAVDGLAFGGFEGSVLWVAQTNAGATGSRILRDLSGGRLGNDVEVIGSFTSPTNATYNAIAGVRYDANTLMVVGDNSTTSFLGLVG